MSGEPDSSATIQEEAGLKGPSRVVFLLVLFLSIGFLLWHGLYNLPRRQTVISTRMDVTALDKATDEYFAEYQHYPEGETATLLRCFAGKNPTLNPKDIVFLGREDKAPPGDLGPAALKDAWGHPFLCLRRTPEGRPVFYSAGPDGIDQQGAPGSDDIFSGNY